MKALQCRSLGRPEDLQIMEVADPVPGPGEVLVKIRAVGLNFFDTLIIKGKYQVKPDLPFSPGGEFCGVVEAVGPGVENLQIGARVIAFPGYGACAEKIVISAPMAVPIPDGVNDETAAGLLITYGTTLHALKNRANLQPGETLAVLGASGGVGLTALEIGTIMGAKVIACASSREKLDLCAAHGADVLIDYKTEDLKTALKAVTPAGIDVVYDPVGGAMSEAALRALGWKGRLLVIGFASGTIPKIPLNLALVKGCSIHGVFWGRFMEEEPDLFAQNTRQLVQWCADGTLKPHVETMDGLGAVVTGLQKLAARKAKGKIVVRL